MVSMSPDKASPLDSDVYEDSDSIRSSIIALDDYVTHPQKGQIETLAARHRFNINDDVRAEQLTDSTNAIANNKPIILNTDSTVIEHVPSGNGVPKEDSRHGVIGLVAAYNEARFIGSVVISAARYVERVVVVDDGSQDDTVLIARAAGADVVEMETNGGKGAAVQHGLDIILGLADVRAIVLLDGDGQHDPAEIPGVVQPIIEGAADLSVGSRFLDVKSDIPAWRQVGQHGLTWFTNLASGTPLTDSQSGFRALSPDAARVLKFQTSDFSMESEMQFTVHDMGLTAVEVPITCVYEEPSKRNPITHGLEVVLGIVQLAAHVRPLLFGIVAAIFLWLIGAALSFDILMAFNQTGSLPLASSLLTAGLIVIGSTAFICGIVLQSVRDLMKRYLVQKVDI